MSKTTKRQIAIVQTDAGRYYVHASTRLVPPPDEQLDELKEKRADGSELHPGDLDCVVFGGLRYRLPDWVEIGALLRDEDGMWSFDSSDFGDAGSWTPNYSKALRFDPLPWLDAVALVVDTYSNCDVRIEPGEIESVR